MSDYFDVGSYTRPITTDSEEAQLWFDRGLIWGYGYNHEEAYQCFQKAVAADADCAMAYWGMAYVSGPFYNLPWEFFGESELKEAVPFCYETVQAALACSSKTSPVEQALIEALALRYQSDQAASLPELQGWMEDFAEAMKKVHTAFPEDSDVRTIYAEAMITRTPWKLWDVHTGQPTEGADTLAAIQLLEAGMRLVEKRGEAPHAGILHMYLHVLEMSPYPERALRAADALRDHINPDVGHLRHMPSHIYALCGDYAQSVAVSEKAIMADEKYLARIGPFNFYSTARCHDYHMKMHAAMLLGQYKPALEAANGITGTISDELLQMDKPQMVSTLEGYYSMKMHVYVRFGKWHEILAEPFPADPQMYCVTTAMFHYARGIAQATLGHLDAAEEERERFNEVLAQIPPGRIIFNNKVPDILAVGAAMLNGELEYHKGNYEVAFAHLRQAVALDDNLYYTEPWAWMHPPRHALGALLSEQNHISEAEQVYRADLGLDNTLSRPCQHPDNVWSLHGYVECLQRQNRHAESNDIRLRFNLALARTDTEIKSSCCCRLKTM